MADKISPGDFVSVHLDNEIVKGTLLPRSKLFDKNSGDKIKVIKLENGYNIGISQSKIKKIELIKKYEKKKSKKVSKPVNPNLKKILIISCGGTISSRIDYMTGGVYADYTAEDFIEMLPELAEIANIDALPLLSKMSEDFSSDDWKSMAKTVEKNYQKYDGFIITQGTDTLHYSSAALSFFLDNLEKPVVFTAAQRSIDRGSSDAFMNLLSSVKFAAESKFAGVFVCMHGTTNDDFCYVHKGTKVRKMHSLKRDAFRSINDSPIAKIHYDNSLKIEYLREDTNSILTENNTDGVVEKLKLKTGFEDKVALIFFHPNMDPNVLNYYIEKGYKGIVFAGTALGHIAMNGPKSFEKIILKLKSKNIPVVMTTQSLYGRVDPLVYSSLRTLSIEGNVIFAEDMLPETAYIKLSWLLSQKEYLQSIKEKMLENMKGEINYTVKEDQFLN